MSDTLTVSEQMDNAFSDFMIEKGYYIKEGDSYITNPKYPYDFQYLTNEWLKVKKEMFGTTSNPATSKGAIKVKKTSSH